MNDKVNTKTILFIENDLDFLRTRQESLELEGYKVLTATTVEEARRKLNARDFDLAIIDIRMIDDKDERDVSGLILATMPAYRDITKIILTDFPTQETVAEVFTEDVDGRPAAMNYVIKQEGLESFQFAIAEALSAKVGFSDNKVSLKIGLLWTVPGLMIGILIMGVLGITTNNPSWLIGVAALGFLLLIIMGRLAIE